MYSSFYNDDDFLRIEHNLLELTSLGQADICDPQARRHVREGFDRRLLMMQVSRIFLREQTRRTEAMGTLCWELNVHLNSYYLNLRGAFDNLAWALKYEFKLLPDVSEDSDKRRNLCNLFHPKFQKLLEPDHSQLAEVLVGLASWKDELSKLRDPAAHRIPLTAVGAVISTPEQLEESRHLESLANGPADKLDGLPRSYYLRQANMVGKYHPLFVVSNPTGLKEIQIPVQVAEDHDRFLRVAYATLQELLSSRDS